MTKGNIIMKQKTAEDPNSRDQSCVHFEDVKKVTVDAILKLMMRQNSTSLAYGQWTVL